MKSRFAITVLIGLISLSANTNADCDPPFRVRDALAAITDGMPIDEVAKIIEKIQPRKMILADGGSSGGGTGGGSGIACFANETDAASARLSWENQTPISDVLVSNVISLQVTDIWERGNDPIAKPKIASNGAMEGVPAYLDRILDMYLGSVSPSFLAKIKTSLARVNLDDSKITETKGALLPIHDTSISQAFLASRCALVQIAKRYSRVDKDGEILVDRIELDHRLYGKLGMIDGKVDTATQTAHQAALRLHEALYLMAYGLGAEKSDLARMMTSQLMLQGDLDADQKTRAIILVRSVYSSGYSDFAYLGKNKYSAEKRSLRDSLVKVQDKMAASHEAARDSYIGSLHSQDKQKIESYPLLTKVVQNASDEEAFMLASQGALERGAIKDFFAIVDPTTDDSEIKKSCEYIDEVIACKKSWRCSGRALFGNKEKTSQEMLRDMVYEKSQRYCERRERK